tara:strand:- start:658 stop:834 length:177 start_codon:yes stop_codon:yes gene_type:complete
MLEETKLVVTIIKVVVFITLFITMKNKWRNCCKIDKKSGSLSCKDKEINNNKNNAYVE